MILRVLGVTGFTLGCALLVLACLAGSAEAATYSNYLYGVNGTSMVSVYGADSGTLVKVINVGGEANAIAASPDGRLIYVTAGDYIKVINTSTDTIVRPIAYPGAGKAVTELAADYDGTLYVMDPSAESVFALRPDAVSKDNVVKVGGYIETEKVEMAWGDTYKYGYQPRHMALSPDGRTLYVGYVYRDYYYNDDGLYGPYLSYSSDRVYAYDLSGVASGSVGEAVATIDINDGDVGYSIRCMAVGPANDRLYVGYTRADEKTDSPTSGTGAVKSIPVGSATGAGMTSATRVGESPAGITCSPDGAKVYVGVLSSMSDSTIVIMGKDAWMDTTLLKIPVVISDEAITADGSKVYCCGLSKVFRLDAATSTGSQYASVPLAHVAATRKEITYTKSASAGLGGGIGTYLDTASPTPTELPLTPITVATALPVTPVPAVTPKPVTPTPTIKAKPATPTPTSGPKSSTPTVLASPSVTTSASSAPSPNSTVTHSGAPVESLSNATASPAASASANSTATPAGTGKGQSLMCFGVPVIGVGMILAVGPLRAAFRKRRLP